MKELIISQIAPIVATTVVAILGVVIKKVGDEAIEFLRSKKNEIEQKIKLSGHTADLKTAEEVWGIVEEKFRITKNAEAVVGSKADYFDSLLTAKIPGLTKENLKYLRQTIAGKYNEGKVQLADDPSNAQIEKLKKENQELQNKITNITNALN